MTTVDWRLIDEQMADVESELLRATKKFGKFNSAHEGYAVIKEELEELWVEIKKNGDLWTLRQEAIQLCAMTLRFLHDITPLLNPTGKKGEKQK